MRMSSMPPGGTAMTPPAYSWTPPGWGQADRPVVGDVDEGRPSAGRRSGRTVRQGGRSGSRYFPTSRSAGQEEGSVTVGPPRRRVTRAAHTMATSGMTPEMITWPWLETALLGVPSR